MQITLKKILLAALPLAGVLFLQSPASADRDWGRHGRHRHSYSRGDHCDSPRKFHRRQSHAQRRYYRDTPRARRAQERRLAQMYPYWRYRTPSDRWRDDDDALRYGRRNYDNYGWRSSRRNYGDYYRGSRYGYPYDPYYNGRYYGSSVPGGVLGLPGAIVGSVVPPLVSLPGAIVGSVVPPLVDLPGTIVNSTVPPLVGYPRY